MTATSLHVAPVHVMDFLDPNAEWDPVFPQGMPPNPVKLPCTFQALTPLLVFDSPRENANLVMDNMIQQGTYFSVEELVPLGKLYGVDVTFMKTKEAFWNGLNKDGADTGGGGWVLDVGIRQDSPWYLKRVVKRFRMM